MTGRARVAALMSGQSFDRFGLKEEFWPETLVVWVGQGYPCDDAGRPVDPQVHFGFDTHACGGWFDQLPLSGFSQVIEETDTWHTVLNGAGAQLKYWKHRSGTPEHVAFRMTSPEVWHGEYRSHLLELDPARVDTDTAAASLARARELEKWAYAGHIFVWETMRTSFGDECMFEAMALDPGWIHDFHQVYLDFYKAHFEYLFQRAGRPDAVFIYEDLAYRNGLFVSEAMLERLVMPYYAQLVDWLKARGLRVHFHSCGNVTQAVPLLIEAGFESLNPMEVKAGCDLPSLVRTYGDRLVFIGGFDVRVLESNDRQHIQSRVAEHLRHMKRLGARHLFGSDHSIPPSVSYDAYRWALDAFWAGASV